MDGNPLRRGLDRTERALWVMLVLGFLAAAPVVAPFAGHFARSAGLTEVKAQRSWREVDAVLLRRAPRQYYGYNSVMTVWVPGQWHAPSGGTRSGLVPTQSGMPAGANVPIWVNRSGQLTGKRPMTTGVVGVRVAAVESLAVTSLAVVTLLLAWLVRWIMDRRRLTYWGIEWACFGPRWSARHLRHGPGRLRCTCAGACPAGARPAGARPAGACPAGARPGGARPAPAGGFPGPGGFSCSATKKLPHPKTLRQESGNPPN
ncbi:MAG TPA: hypothetical protein VFQ44_14265 [Streptosporangiaceae bacterium]|nr:hypothetical protein [Streptosporangiaceae bacterium]